MIYKFSQKLNNKVISSLILYTVKLPSRKLGVIEEVWTDERYRRQGRSTRLMKKAIRHAKKLKLDCVELTVREDSPHIQKFYKSLGFFDRKNRAFRLKL